MPQQLGHPMTHFISSSFENFWKARHWFGAINLGTYRLLAVELFGGLLGLARISADSLFYGQEERRWSLFSFLLFRFANSNLVPEIAPRGRGEVQVRDEEPVHRASEASHSVSAPGVRSTPRRQPDLLHSIQTGDQSRHLKTVCSHGYQARIRYSRNCCFTVFYPNLDLNPLAFSAPWMPPMPQTCHFFRGNDIALR